MLKVVPPHEGYKPLMAMSPFEWKAINYGWGSAGNAGLPIGVVVLISVVGFQTAQEASV